MEARVSGRCPACGRGTVVDADPQGGVTVIDTLNPVPRLDPAEVAAHYDDLDRYYRGLWGEHVHHGLFDAPGMSPEEATRRLIAVVAGEAAVGPGSVVCDVGCGYGGTSRVLAREYGADVTGLTI